MMKTITAGLLSAPLAFNSPGGHQILYEIGLRMKFTEAVKFAEELEERDLSFDDFKMFAPYFLQLYYKGDEKMMQTALEILSVSLCIPSPESSHNPVDWPQQLGCHAGIACRRDGDHDEFEMN